MSYKRALLLLSLLFSAAWAYIPQSAPPHRCFVPRGRATTLQHEGKRSSSGSTSALNMSSSTSTTKASVTDFLKSLLEDLSGPKLLENSSESWRNAIYEAVGAPPTADEKIVAKALGDAMSKPDNQFAILMGQAEDFVATFPSDPVEDAEKGETWVECRLRGADDDELLVTMGITLQNAGNGSWLIRSLDWQDFRDKFYPGLSGREWLRAF